MAGIELHAATDAGEVLREGQAGAVYHSQEERRNAAIRRAVCELWVQQSGVFDGAAILRLAILCVGNGVCDRRSAPAIEVSAEVRVDDYAGTSDDQQGRVLGVFQRVAEAEETECDEDLRSEKQGSRYRRQHRFLFCLSQTKQ